MNLVIQIWDYDKAVDMFSICCMHSTICNLLGIFILFSLKLKDATKFDKVGLKIINLLLITI